MGDTLTICNLYSSLYLYVSPYLNEHVLGISVEVVCDVLFWITESGAARAWLHTIVIEA